MEMQRKYNILKRQMLWVIGIEEKESCSKDIEYIFKRVITKDSQLGKNIPSQTQDLRHQTTKSRKEPLSSDCNENIKYRR